MKEKDDDAKLNKNHHISDQSEDALSNQQAELLDELTTGLSHTQAELEIKAHTIQEQEANQIVKNHVLAGSAVGLVPLPLFDLVALSGTQYSMLESLSYHYSVDFNKKNVKSALISLLSGSLPTLTLLSLSSVSKLIPGIGTSGGNASLTLLGGAVTYATGKTFIKHFSEGGTLNDFDADKLSNIFKSELTKGKQVMTSVISRKIKPIASPSSVSS